ncbi:hypothetical protein [Micromonospora sp. NBC_01813]|uniref:hypothetical protein n=1 Tax=Micromonospora sp. NBC_01813 TaxID=2975988 RepID=UPI002DD9A187|nr:hypothetical protein [Micromonospora sp. NBC_01813]WSA06740.1 hypothetical protein OG958_20915 [Micromonospora sp. NBC_01813]
MSAPEAEEEPRRTVPLKWLTWGGLGLAPLAAVLLLLGDGDGSLRLAMVIAIAAVMLIGLSITLRGGIETMRTDMEDALVEEMDVLRDDVRNDISTAVRASHRAFGEKVQSVEDSVEALRGQVDAVRGEVVRAESARVESARADRADYDRFDSAAPASAVPASSMPASGPAGYGGQYPAGQYGAATGGRASVPAVSGTVLPRQPASNGVARRTETVQATSRPPSIDPRADVDAGGTVYGGARPAARGGAAIDGEWSAQSPRSRRSAEPAEDSWTERRLREQAGDRWSWDGGRDDSSEQRYGGRADERWDVGRADGYGTGSPAERWSAGRDDDGYPARSAGTTGNGRYAEDNGRYAEDRVGGDRPSDGRYGDRFDRDELRSPRDDARFDGPVPGPERLADEPPWRDARWDQRGADLPTDGPPPRRAALPALPAGSGAEVPPWSSGPVDAEPGRRSRRYRDEEDTGRRLRDDDGAGGRRSREYGADPGRRYGDEGANGSRYRDADDAGGGRRFRDYEEDTGRRLRDDDGAGGRRSREYGADPGRRYGDEGANGSRYRDADDAGGGRRSRDYEEETGRRFRDDDDGRGRYRDDYQHSDDRRWR